MAEAQLSDRAGDSDRPKLRQVQHDGRRYAISIEPVYWACLEEAAEEIGIRLNQMVALLAQADDGPKNLAARLRLFCVKSLRRQVHEARLVSRAVNMVQLIDAVPSACFAITQQRRIAYANEPLHAMIGEPTGKIVGDPADKYFRLRFSDPTADPIENPDLLPSGLLSGSVALMIPGRLAARRMVVCPVPLRQSDQILFVVFIR